MSSHTFHPDSHTHGLADGCPRCEEHAQHPLRTLDNNNLRALMYAVLDEEEPRSENERLAMREIEDVLQAAGKLATVAPHLLAQYVFLKFHVQVPTVSVLDVLARKEMSHD